MMHTTVNEIDTINEKKQESLREEIIGLLGDAALSIEEASNPLPSDTLPSDIPPGNMPHIEPAAAAEPAIVLDFVWNDQRFVVLHVSKFPDSMIVADEEPEQDKYGENELEEVRLSPREQEIVRLVAKGYPNKTIAGILDISPWTVSTHLRRVFAKLGVNSRAEMVATAIHTQLITTNSA